MSKRKTVTLKIQHVRKDILSIKKESKLSLTAVNHHELHCGPAQPHLPRALKSKGALLRGWPPASADMAQKANAGPPDSALGSLNLGGQKSEPGGDRGTPMGVGRNALLRATLMGERKHGESSGWPTLSKHTPLTLEMYPRKKKSKARHRGVCARMHGMVLFTAKKMANCKCSTAQAG